MGQLVLVRHGQASFFGRNYDSLSPIGFEQSRALGEHWATHGVAFDRVWIGPRLRHRQTHDAVAAVYRERGLPWPTPVELPDLDEHHGIAVIRHQLGRSDVDADAFHPEEVGDGEREHVMRQALKQYLEILREYVRGNVNVEGVETWLEFRARALRALDLLCTQPGRSSAAFTSGGFVCAAIGWILGIDEDRVLDLAIALRNTGLTEVAYTGRRRNLVSFNGLPHLADPKHLTAV